MRTAGLFLAFLATAAALAFGFKRTKVDPATINDTPRPEISVPYATVAPRINGDMDDLAWVNAAIIPALAPMFGPEAKGQHGQPTEVRLLWDEKFFYVRYLCTDDALLTTITGHDQKFFTEDAVELFFDPKGDARQNIEVQINPKGCITDIMLLYVAAKVPLAPDLTWRWPDRNTAIFKNIDWTCEGLRTASGTLTDGPLTTGWIVDVAVPAVPLLYRLGKTTFAPMTLRANFLRYDWVPTADPATRDLIALNWSPERKGCPHLSPAGHGYVKLVDTRKKPK
jgi:hypothetical protein